MEIIEDELLIYTDGSSKQNSRRGGIGIKFIFPDYANQKEYYEYHSEGSFVGATNQQMELKACIVALEKCLEFEGLDKLHKITFFTDSSYVKDNVNNALVTWPKRKWLSSNDITPVENSELWKDLTRVMNKFSARIYFEKVKAHRKGKLKDIHNDEVDKLAKEGADNPIKIPFNVINARKKYSPYMAKKGSVDITTDKVTIRIIECTSYKKHKNIFKMKYVVCSEGSYNKKLDWVYHIERMLEGHTYIVNMKVTDGIPFIEEVHDDITKNSRFFL